MSPSGPAGLVSLDECPALDPFSLAHSQTLLVSSISQVLLKSYKIKKKKEGVNLFLFYKNFYRRTDYS